ncbi:MAG: alpha/beta hydrolase, partial [Planctomycetes bacterium]|nr:alpha/beta hydrolase [Planctomycetota bacterium]
PDVYLSDAGMVMLEPYRTDQIPVVMVHGLYSSPETWVGMFNDLRGDPVIRENFQFWFFRYPTGLPIIYSASLLREELLDMRKTFGADGGDSNFDKMILIGHSMGGLLTRLMVQDSESYYYDDVFKVGVEELSMSAEQKELIRNVLFFEALPFIKRVVFIATPHRGSSEAETFIAGLGAGFIQMPQQLKDIGNMLKANAANLSYVPGKRERPILTSIDQLSPSSSFMEVMEGVEIRRDIPYHSIVAIRNSKTAEGASDGIVTYESAHVDFAVSEKLVPSEHFAQKHPVTIGEIKRILRVHLAEYRPKTVTFGDQ